MKKIKVILVMLMAICLMVIGGCGGTGTSSNESGKDKPSGETNEQVLFEDDNVKVSFIEIFEMPELVGTCYVRLKVENKSSKTVNVSLKDTYVNDIAQMMGTGLPIVLESGKTSQQPFFFGYGNLSIDSKDEIRKIEFKVWLTDNGNYDTVVETDTLVVEFNK